LNNYGENTNNYIVWDIKGEDMEEDSKIKHRIINSAPRRSLVLMAKHHFQGFCIWNHI